MLVPALRKSVGRKAPTHLLSARCPDDPKRKHELCGRKKVVVVVVVFVVKGK